ncbi:hypothetical protein BDN70DRAFT_939242 [Pholiota conissans]|uniref:Uncharacterized protein n=1 Tax=Pholiota conissans TaxID=109636 RepID=A0A9P6CLU9_9AGAR|nr:hypothetical protein BDN70DRAFT_939242 [Pholiota conissans]
MAPISYPYFANRLLSIAGYYCPPVIIDVLSYWLPPFKRLSSRFVAIGCRKWELWSPNSPTAPFYPGLHDSTFSVESDPPETLQRGDGHCGRFDPTVSPQVFSTDQPWLPFVRRHADPAVYPEFSPFLTVWDERRSAISDVFHSALGRRLAVIQAQVDSWGEVRTTFPELWDRRPLPPDGMDHEVLGRKPKIASAWVRMVSAVSSSPRNAPPYDKDVREVDDSLMGTWINGTAEVDGKWLLRLRIPCFVIHELDSEADWFHGAGAGYLQSFVTGTPVADLGATKNPLDIAILRNGGRLFEGTREQHLATHVPPSTWGDRYRSSSYSQGWSADGYKDPEGSISLVPFEERDGFILPPPVAHDLSGGGQWTSWEEDRDERGNYCFSKLTAHEASAHDGEAWYDRENRRVLLFEDAPRTPRFYYAHLWKPGSYMKCRQ